MMNMPVKNTAVRLADDRELIYFGEVPERPHDYPDGRQLPAMRVSSQRRYDPLLGEWVVIASHRQHRAVQPSDDQCPLCPSTAGRRTEIPAPAYDVVVFENRFPTLAAEQSGTLLAGDPAGPGGPGAGQDSKSDPAGLLVERPAAGRCELICFSQDHAASFADLTADQAEIVLEAWIDRTTALSAMPGIEQVFCFENRGPEIGATLSHPHGQIHAFPYVTPRTSRMLSTCTTYRQRTGRNLFDDMLAAELSGGSRVVSAREHWTALVPHAARWPYEVHLYPHRRVPDLAGLSDAARSEFCELYLDMLGRFDRLFDIPAPYISALHQAPVRRGRDELALHIELFTIQRAPGKLKYTAGSEAAMGAFSNDIEPEAASQRLRELG